MSNLPKASSLPLIYRYRAPILFFVPTNYKLLRPTRKPEDVVQVLADFESDQLREGRENDPAKAAITLLLSKKPFRLRSFIREAPTGVESPPSPRRFSDLTFFKYGPGGGGVAYDDVYYFNLRGKTLKIVFDGPFDGLSKSPSAHTLRPKCCKVSEFIRSYR